MLKPDLRDQVNGSPYRFCVTAACPVAYYAADRPPLRKDQLRVRVGVKETQDPIPVCYCFGVTEGTIREEIQRAGRSSASARIRTEVTAGTCRCDVENPSGRCCLGAVARAETRAAAEITERGAARPSPDCEGERACDRLNPEKPR